MLRTGSIVRHVFRKSAVYLLVIEAGKNYLFRVRKMKGYPIVDQRAYCEPDLKKLTEIGFGEQYEGKTLAQIKEMRTGENALPPCQNIKDIPEAARREFINLASELSPENLSCDGELSRSRVRQKYNSLKGQWARLERKLGFTVTESQAWDSLRGMSNEELLANMPK